MKTDVLILRIAFVGLLILLGYLLNPFERTQRFGLGNLGSEESRRVMSALLGAVIATLIIGFEMRVRRANGTVRTLKLLDWRDLGGVRMPMRRVFLSEDGTRALEIVFTQIDIRQILSDGLFRPSPR